MTDPYQRAFDLLLEAQRALTEGLDQVPPHDRQALGLPSFVQGGFPGGARIEAALYATISARHLVSSAMGNELPGQPILQRTQRFLALAGGYVALASEIEAQEREADRSSGA
ncbi:hypothetical protein [Kitasatospora azatica]|uniref:hypothetical protein n=1 Tax=Kitasatospora azatica TaxID=58347 RepID=UPI00056BBA0D|nr:hypothetical protein [Kitasatospora azatica]